MALIIGHRRQPGLRLAWLGAGYGMWAHSHVHARYDLMPHQVAEGERAVLFGCDAKGQIRLVSTRYAQVLSVDGLAAEHAVAEGAPSATVVSGPSGDELFLGAAISSWADSKRRSQIRRFAVWRDGSVVWREGGARVASVAGASPVRAFKGAAEVRSRRPLIARHMRDAERYLVLDAGLGVLRAAPAFGFSKTPPPEVERVIFAAASNGQAVWLTMAECSIVGAGETSLGAVLAAPGAAGLTRVTPRGGGGHGLLLGTGFSMSAWASAGMRVFGHRKVRSGRDETAVAMVCSHRGAIALRSAADLRISLVAGRSPPAALVERSGGYR